jgi:uncharacterized protein (TIGR02646 family)
MRAIDKGDWPINEKTQKQVKFHSDKVKPNDDTTYRKAKPYLVETVGIRIKKETDNSEEAETSNFEELETSISNYYYCYCSYCERRIDYKDIHIEHKLPKDEESAYPEKRGDWDNFLLACNSCDSTKRHAMEKEWQLEKGKNPPNIDEVLDAYYWPDQDNTICLFEYERGGLISINKYLTNYQQEKVEKTLNLTGITRLKNYKDEDNFLLDARREEWRKAQRQLKKFERHHKSQMIEDIEEDYKDIIDIVKGTGFWSVWMTVFQDYPKMQKKLIEAFPGTCFFYVRCDENPEFKNLVAKFDPELADRLVKVWNGKAWMVVSREDERKLSQIKQFYENNQNLDNLNFDEFPFIMVYWRELVARISPDLASRLHLFQLSDEQFWISQSEDDEKLLQIIVDFIDDPNFDIRNLTQAFPEAAFTMVRCQGNSKYFRELVVIFDPELAESLISVCGGNAWIIISEEDEKWLEEIIESIKINLEEKGDYGITMTEI